MEVKTKPHDIWSEYEKLTEYLTRREVYETVKQNEAFYDGKQWAEMGDSDLPKPVINFIKTVVKHMISSISSNDIAIAMTPFSRLADDIDKLGIIENAIENVIEQDKLKEKSKIMVRDAGVEGTSFILSMFNPNFETGQEAKGRVESTLLGITNTYFGNPYSKDIQDQPYIIVSLRQHISQVRKEAKAMGVSEELIESIKADNESNQVNDDSEDLVTVLLKFYKVKRKELEVIERVNELNEIVVEENEKDVETVWFVKTTKDVCLIEPTDLGYTRYPLACFGWESVKNSYLYTSPITEVITNQIFVNKCYSLAQMYAQQTAFPKIVYDKSKIDIEKFLNNTSPTAVAGIDMMGKFLDFIKIPDFSGNIIELAQDVMKQTKECMGISDATLGNVRPDNAQAIIALQESSSVPLEIQRGQFFEMWEDLVRNIIDIMSVTYGVRELMTEDNQFATVDFSIIKDINFDLKVDVGGGAQFDEISKIQTNDKLFQLGVIDPITYIDSIPRKFIANKSKILKSLQDRNQMAQAMPMQMPNGNLGNQGSLQ